MRSNGVWGEDDARPVSAQPPPAPALSRGPSFLRNPHMPFVYIITNEPYGTLYTGFANHLARRIEQHRTSTVPGFAKTFRLDRLVWYEFHESAYEARMRERAIKRWRRMWKVTLIQAMNPAWRDLCDEIGE